MEIKYGGFFCLICGIPRNLQHLESKKKNPSVASYLLVPSYEEKPPPQVGYSLKPGRAPQRRLRDKAPTCAAASGWNRPECRPTAGSIAQMPHSPRPPFHCAGGDQQVSCEHLGKRLRSFQRQEAQRWVLKYVWDRAEMARSVGLCTRSPHSELFYSYHSAEISFCTLFQF